MLATFAPAPDAVCPKGVAVARFSVDSPSKFEYVIAGAPDGSQSLQAEDGTKFEPLPELRPQVASHLHVAGPSGCGKSTFANLYAKNFKECTGGAVFVFSADISPDPALTYVDGRFGIDESLAEVPLEELRRVNQSGEPVPSLLIFDDVEGLPKPRAVALRVFTQGVKERGRKMGLHSLSIYHKGAGNLVTRDSLAEATGYVFFPDRLNSNTTYMLNRYCGLSNEISGMIRNGKWGRWVMVYPGLAILGERKMSIIDPAVLTAIAKAEKKRLTKAASRAMENPFEGASSAQSLLAALDFQKKSTQ